MARSCSRQSRPKRGSHEAGSGSVIETEQQEYLASALRCSLRRPCIGMIVLSGHRSSGEEVERSIRQKDDRHQWQHLGVVSKLLDFVASTVVLRKASPDPFANVVARGSDTLKDLEVVL